MQNNKLIMAIRHDLHKICGQKHTNKHDWKVGHPDLDALKMSRNRLSEPVWEEDDRNYRRSLLNNQLLMDINQENRVCLRERILSKYDPEKHNTETMFMSLLGCMDISQFNESVDLAFTSLKYHSILTTVLYYNYLRGYEFKDLCFAIINIDDKHELFETIFIDKVHNKCMVLKPFDITLKFYTKPGKPIENFGNVISRCGNTEHIEPYIFSNLRRISSWSTGLQYYEDVLNENILNVVDPYKGVTQLPIHDEKQEVNQ